MTDAWPADLMVRLQRDADEIERLTAELDAAIKDRDEARAAITEIRKLTEPRANGAQKEIDDD